MTETQLEHLKSQEHSFRVYSTRLKLQREAGEYVTNCPFGHTDKTPSFHVFKYNGIWMFKCFSGSCGASGNCVQFVQRFDNISFSMAAKKVEQELGAAQKESVDSIFKSVAPAQEYKTISLSDWKRYEDELERSPTAKAFLATRGISYETAKDLHFGCRRELGNGGGEAANTSEIREWLAFPAIRSGKVVSVEFRAVSPTKWFSRAKDMETSLRGMDFLDPLEPVYLVEGWFDLAVMHQSGFKAVSLPSAGYKLTPEEKDALLEAEQVILAGDQDAPGNDATDKLWSELNGMVALTSKENRVFKLRWPCKDANEAYIKNPGKFKELVKDLTLAARSEPLKNFYSLPESLERGDRTNLADHPHRWHAPWPSVDGMVRILPGGILGITGTNTGVGKTTFAMQAELYEALKYNEVVINYSGELSVDEYSNLVAAHVLGVDRTKLQYLDYKLAAKKLQGIKFYTGFSPDLNGLGPVLDLIEAAIPRLGASRVILDHLHYFGAGESNQIEAQANAMRRIKAMCQKYGVIFLVLGQPRKAKQELRGKSIHLSDVKGSEAVVSTADAFMTIHREVAKMQEGSAPPKDPYQPETFIQLLKGRSLGGGSSFARLYTHGEIATMVEPLPENKSSLFSETVL